jgi:hypothetical protein
LGLETNIVSSGSLKKAAGGLPRRRDECNKYYFSVCKSLGLNPLTRPFEYLTLNGKKVLYARRDSDRIAGHGGWSPPVNT